MDPLDNVYWQKEKAFNFCLCFKKLFFYDNL